MSEEKNRVSSTENDIQAAYGEMLGSTDESERERLQARIDKLKASKQGVKDDARQAEIVNKTDRSVFIPPTKSEKPAGK